MNVLAVRLSALGDVVHTIPAVLALKAKGAVAWVVEAPYAELVEIVAGVRAIPVRLKQWSPTEMRAAWRSVRGFDVAVDFQGNIKSALVARASNALERWGFEAGAVRERPAAFFYTRHAAIDQTRHVVEWNLALAEAVTGSRQPATGNWSAFAADPHSRLARYAGRVVVLPGAGRANKRWPVDRFREIVRRFDAVVVWGPGEKELAAAVGGEMAPETNLRELAHVLQHARVVVGGDTGPLHLAAALGTRVVGIYGPTDPRRNGPYGQRQGTVDSYGTTRLVEAVTLAQVIDSLNAALTANDVK